MKKTKILSVVAMSVAIVLIVVGYSIIFINDYTVDAKETSNYASLIKNSYNSYSNEVEDISFEISKTTIFNVNYYAEIRVNYEKSINELNLIENHIKDIKSTSELLLNECQARSYNDYDIDNKCSTLVYNYESIINAYLSLVDKYNERIDAYNAWSNYQNVLGKYKPTYYKEYVDLDLDGVYSGKIE